jgi:hypothetical protein
MGLHPALDQLIQTKLAHTRAPQWTLPIAEVRKTFRNLWKPSITGQPLGVDRVEDMAVAGLFVGMSISGLPMEKLMRPLMPFLCAIIAVIFVVAFVPEITLWLPKAWGLIN